MDATVAISIAVVFFFIASAIIKWNELVYSNKCLPPGTMGWPVFGETVQFLKYGSDFVKKKRLRHGNFFKTHVLGSPMIISTDACTNRYILLNEAKGIVPGYPQSMLDILGKNNIGALHGSAHKNVRGSILALVGHSSVRDRLLLKIDSFVREYLADWTGTTIDLQIKTKEYVFLSALRQIGDFGCVAAPRDMMNDFLKVFNGTFSLPINIPGTKYYTGIQGRNTIVKVIKDVIKERRGSDILYDDMLDMLLGRPHVSYKLSEEEIIDQIITVLYSGFETVSTTLMMALKHLHDHPEALQKVREENFEVKKKTDQNPITWEDYKSMEFTRGVVLETLRLAVVVNGVLRKTTQEVELNGFIIPKGWRIYVYTTGLNHDPSFYPEPMKFNPWRWLEKGVERHEYFLLFGGGKRVCPGKELGIAEISTFIHYFVTKFRWEEIGGEEFISFPRVMAPNGLHVRVSNF